MIFAREATRANPRLAVLIAREAAQVLMQALSKGWEG